MSETNKNSGDAGRPRRRDFLKITACAPAALALGSIGSDARSGMELRLDARRVRPGATVTLTAGGRASDPAGAPRAHLVEVSPDDGRALRYIETVRGEPGGRGAWRADVIARGLGEEDKRESYWLAAAWRTADGGWVTSNAVEVVCTPLMVGL